jgi:membrane-associated phospholipid phosphatase
MSLLDKSARIVSIALIPPTLSALSFALLTLAYQHGSLFHKLLIWVIATLFSGVIQIFYVLKLKKDDEVTDYDVPLKEQRNTPYMVSIGLAIVGFTALCVLNASIYVLALMFCHITNTLILLLINRYWKISAHMLGFAGVLPALIPLFGIYLIISAPFLILLGWARVQLKSHNLLQVVAGAALGFVLTYLQLFIIFSYVIIM